jgi:hypothetical protein
MPILETQTTSILLTACVGLSLLGLFVMLWLARRLSRIERLMTSQVTRVEAAESVPSAAETSPGGAFEAFLSEDPERRRLTKGEQFAAYRQWRQEKGLNWSA